MSGFRQTPGSLDDLRPSAALSSTEGGLARARQAAPGRSGVLTMNFASATASLSTMGTILGVMAALALVEALIPLHARDEWGRRHLVPNLALTFLTFATNLVFNTLLLVALVWLQS